MGFEEEGGYIRSLNTSGAYSLDVGRPMEVAMRFPWQQTVPSLPVYLCSKKVRGPNNETKELDLVLDASASVSGVVLAKQDVLDANGGQNGTKNAWL